MEAEVQAAKDAAARALLEAEAAKLRAERAERAEAAASDALAKVRAELKQGKKEASDIVAQLDDAFERTQASRVLTSCCVRVSAKWCLVHSRSPRTHSGAHSKL